MVTTRAEIARRGRRPGVDRRLHARRPRGSPHERRPAPAARRRARRPRRGRRRRDPALDRRPRAPGPLRRRQRRLQPHPLERARRHRGRPAGRHRARHVDHGRRRDASSPTGPATRARSSTTACGSPGPSRCPTPAPPRSRSPPPSARSTPRPARRASTSPSPRRHPGARQGPGGRPPLLTPSRRAGRLARRSGDRAQVAQPVGARTPSSSRPAARPAGRRPRPRAPRRARRRPRPRAGPCPRAAARTVVSTSGASHGRSMPSNPATDTSSGTRSPSSRAARTTPEASRSLSATIAVGRSATLEDLVAGAAAVLDQGRGRLDDHLGDDAGVGDAGEPPAGVRVADAPSSPPPRAGRGGGRGRTAATRRRTARVPEGEQLRGPPGRVPPRSSMPTFAVAAPGALGSSPSRPRPSTTGMPRRVRAARRRSSRAVGQHDDGGVHRGVLRRAGAPRPPRDGHEQEAEVLLAEGLREAVEHLDRDRVPEAAPQRGRRRRRRRSPTARCAAAGPGGWARSSRARPRRRAPGRGSPRRSGRRPRTRARRSTPRRPASAATSASVGRCVGHRVGPPRSASHDEAREREQRAQFDAAASVPADWRRPLKSIRPAPAAMDRIDSTIDRDRHQDATRHRSTSRVRDRTSPTRHVVRTPGRPAGRAGPLGPPGPVRPRRHHVVELARPHARPCATRSTCRPPSSAASCSSAPSAPC